MEKKKYYKFTIDFESETDRDEFKNYVHHIKMSTGKPIYCIVTEMMKKEKNK